MSTRERASRLGYACHIASAAWRNSPARLEELRLAGGRCRICDLGAPEVRIEVHHRTYKRFGRERPGDLTTLCSDCHRCVTDLLRRRRFSSLALPELPDTPRVLAGREITSTLTWTLPWQND